MKKTRIPPEDPEDVRRRDDAYLERYVGEKWAGRPSRFSGLRENDPSPAEETAVKVLEDQEAA